MTAPAYEPEVRTVHRGVPVLTRDLPGPITGTLHFAVGTQDEPLHLMGITHLVEHLVCVGITDPHPAHNAQTGPDRMSFWAIGSPDEVARYLNAVAASIRALATISDAVVHREKKILIIENPQNADGLSEGLLSYRHGAFGLGRADLGETSVAALTRDDVVAWGRQWLTGANAALTFTGPVPAALEVDLPDGPAAVREPVPVRGHPTRSLIRSDKAGVAFSFVSTTAEPELWGLAFEHEVSQRLRDEAGLVYSVGRWIERSDDSSWRCMFVLDPLPEDTVETAVRLVELCHELRSRPLSAAAVEAARVIRRVELECVAPAGMASLDERAVDELRGRTARTLEESYAAATDEPSRVLERLTRELREALDSVQVAIHEDAPDDDARLHATGLTPAPPSAWRPDPTPVRGQRFRSRWNGPVGPGSTLTLGTDRLQGRGRGEQDSIHFSDVVLALRHEDGSLMLLDVSGNRAVIDPAAWSRGENVVRDLAAALAVDVIDVGPVPTQPPTG